MRSRKKTTKRTTRKAATKKRRNAKPTAKQLAARRKFAAAAKARSRVAKAKKATKRKNKTVIVKPRKVTVVEIGKLTRRKVRNGYVDLVIRGQAEKTPQGWKIGRKTIPQGKGTVLVSSGYYLDKASGTIFAKRARNTKRKIGQVWIETRGTLQGKNKYMVYVRTASGVDENMYESTDKSRAEWEAKTLRAKLKKKTHDVLWILKTANTARKTIFAKRARNVAAGFYDSSGVFHPIRSAADYDDRVAGETGKKPIRTRSKKKIAATRKASATARQRAETKRRKATTTRLATRSLQRSVPLKRKRKNSNGASPAVKKLREKFTGQMSRKTSQVFAPKGTPANVAKLGKLALIETETARIKPTGTVYLCADAKGKLHLCGSTDAPLYSGPRQNFGQVLKVEYETAKPHLYPGQGTILFYHRMGEEGGKRPTLIGDGKGGLKFRGGSYRITREGIVD